MNLVFILSVLLKGIGAVIEILLQVIITHKMGVADYGVYSTYVNAADLIYWCLFSGLVKCNTFYLSEQGATIKQFKRKYYFYYVIPVTLAGMIGSLFMQKYLACIVFGIALMELIVMDFSSSFMARSHYIYALFGEYVLGRFLLLLCIAAFITLDHLTIGILVFLYLVQFGLVGIYFLVQRMGKKQQYPDQSQVSLKKWGNYQRADILQSLIGQMPVILQYLVVGSFEAGVVSVVMLVKKLVNFISGPSFKVFLPEFSRLYKDGNMDGIRKSYALIMRMQMLFLGPLAVVLVGYPSVLLNVMANELTQYTILFVICSVIFILVASIGPCSGLLQMTGCEVWDNRFREIALAGMILTFWIFHKEPLFVLYGLCVQTIIENTGKFIFVSRWMGKLPVNFWKYLSWWILPAVLITLTYICKVENSFWFMMLAAGLAFCVNMIYEIKDQSLMKAIKNRKKY